MKNTYPQLFFFLFLSFSTFAQQNFNLSTNSDRFSIQLDTKEQTIHLCGLSLGHQYEISVLADGTVCEILLQNQLTTNKVIQFMATSTCQSLSVKKQCNTKTKAYLSIAKLHVTATQTSHPEDNLIITGGVAANDLIQDVLIGNGCSINLNVQKHGEDVQFGTFTNGSASIGFENGLIISSGNINNASGPNNSGSQGTNVPNNNTDPDLSAVVTQSTYDAAVLEFDFTPVSDKISFEYVFASEEYCEFVNKAYNDVFGFFISGPGIVGTKNIARVPGTNEIVSIDNINHLKNSSFFNPNSSTCGGTSNMSDIQFDGYTTPLVATISVIPCETYHIKLAIADVGDGIYDSAVFLKAGSFNAGDLVQVTPTSSIIQAQNSLEGCNNGYLVFDRSCSNDINQPVTLAINVLPSSTATEGADYLALPSSITIPAGVVSDSIPIFALDDGILEGDETINVEITGQYPCYKPTATITISDKIPFQAIGVDTSLCENTTATFQPNIQGGFGPFSYAWSNGDSISMLSQIFSTSELITCIVTDICQNQSQALFDVSVIPPSTGQLDGDGTLCNSNSTSTINLQFTGTPPWDVTVEKDGVTYFTKQYNTSTSNFDVNQVGVYKIQSISAYGCPGTALGQAEIENTTLDATSSQTNVACFADSTGFISVQPLNGATPYHFSWSTSLLDTLSTNSQLPSGSYTFTVTDNDGCTIEQTIQITEPTELAYFIDSVQHVNCFSPQGGLITTQTIGGTLPYQYAWSNGSSNAHANTLSQGIITGIVTDNNGCSDTIQMTIIGDFVEPTTSILLPDTINCYQTEISLSAQGPSIGSNFIYQWTTTDGQILQGATTLNPTINLQGNYALVTTNSDNGCTSSSTIQVFSDTIQPTVDAGTTFALNCTDTTTILGSPNSTLGWQYQWSTSNGHFIGQLTSATTIVDAPGLYHLLVTNLNNGCTNTDNVEITEIATRPDNAFITTEDPSCLEYDGTIMVSDIRGGTPPYLISYDGGQTFYDTTAISSLNQGDYNIVIQDIYGCEYQLNTSLQAPANPTLNVVPEYFIQLGDSVQLETHSSVNAIDLDTIIWSPSPDTTCIHCLSPFAKPFVTTEYEIKIIDKLHCEASAKILVMVQDPGVYIPNIFSPEGTVQGNWSFTIFTDPRSIKSIKQLQIFDRWGNQVFANKDFEPNNMQLGWDGQYRGKKAPAGVYIYSAEIEFINGKKKLYSGDITLVR